MAWTHVTRKLQKLRLVCNADGEKVTFATQISVSCKGLNENITPGLMTTAQSLTIEQHLQAATSKKKPDC